MSDEPNSKRRKMNKQKYHQKSNKPKNFLEPGIRGFFATCNFREKECVRECYNLLNEYVDQEPIKSENQAAIENEKPPPKDALNDSGAVGTDDEEEEDISTLLEKEIKTITSAKTADRNRFQQVETGVGNCIFIKTTVPDPNELGVRIVRHIAETKKRKTRFLLRIWPVDTVCRANIEDIKSAAGKLFDKVFLNAPPTTYSVAFNKRFNNSIDRMTIIQELAVLMNFKNSANKVDLNDPKVTVLVEVVKGLCCISILPDYLKLKKYNVHELTNEDKPAEGEKPAEGKKPDEGKKPASDEKMDAEVKSTNEENQGVNAEPTKPEASVKQEEAAEKDETPNEKDTVPVEPVSDDK